MRRHRLPIVLTVLAVSALTGVGASLAIGGHTRIAAPTIVSAPAARTTATTATFTYRANVRRRTFRCSIDGSRYRRCRARRTYAQLAVGAHSFCVQVASGRLRSAAACYAWTITAAGDVVAPPARTTAAAAQEFSIRGDATDPLLPGGAPVPVEVAISNPNDVPITVQSITMRVTGVVPGACAAAIVVARQLAATPVVPARSTRTLRQLGVPPDAWPALAMLDTKTNQDACEHGTIALGYSGSAVG